MRMKAGLKRACAAAPALAAILLCGGPARATDYAYMVTGTTATEFGVVDLSTGVFSVCGTMPAQLAGLGVGPDHKLYGGVFLSHDFYTVDLRNGALTLVGTSSIDFFLQGSTSSALYAVGTDSNLYTIDQKTGAASLIGPLKISVDEKHSWGMSTNSKALYMTENGILFKINLKTGAAKQVNASGQGTFGGEVVEHNILYAGNFSPLSIYTIDPKTGSSAFLANLSGADVADPWGLAPIREQSISRGDICKPHRIP